MLQSIINVAEGAPVDSMFGDRGPGPKFLPRSCMNFTVKPKDYGWANAGPEEQTKVEEGTQTPAAKLPEPKVFVDRAVGAEVLMIDENVQVERHRFERESESQTTSHSLEETAVQATVLRLTGEDEAQTESECGSSFLTGRPSLPRADSESSSAVSPVGHESVFREDVILKLLEEDEKDNIKQRSVSENQGKQEQKEEPLESFFNYVCWRDTW